MEIDHRLYVRLRKEEKNMLEQMYEWFRATSKSSLVRKLIRTAYNYPDVFEYYIMKEGG